jgi:glutaredoxin
MSNVVVWSKVNCPQCDTVKQLLKANGVTYEERVIGKGYTVQDLLDLVPTAKSVPQLFLDGQHVPTVNDLTKALNIA